MDGCKISLESILENTVRLTSNAATTARLVARMPRRTCAFLLAVCLPACGVDHCPPNTREESGLCIRQDPVSAGGGGTSGSDAGGGAGTRASSTSASAIESAQELDDGEACETNEACASGHCDGGFCCASGSCCRSKYDCPTSYSKRAQCTEASTCQGIREEAACTEHVCGTEMVEDDSGCGSTTLALPCDGSPVYCGGQTNQRAPRCPEKPAGPSSMMNGGTAGRTGGMAIGGSPSAMGGSQPGMAGAPSMMSGPAPGTCDQDTDCSATEYCSSGRCVADALNGESCPRSAACQSGYCSRGVCCSSGQCCRNASECAPPRSVCMDVSSCSGVRITQECRNSTCVDGAGIPDHTACNGRVAKTCGAYANVVCQDVPAQACATTCLADDNCAPGYGCLGQSICVKRCTRDEECNAAEQEFCGGPGLCADI